MNKEITSTDVKIMAELQRAWPMTKRPFKSIAEKIGLTEREVIEKTRSYGDNK